MLVGGRDESSHERTQLLASDEVPSTVEESSDHREDRSQDSSRN